MSDAPKPSRKARRMTGQERAISEAKGKLGEHMHNAVIVAAISDPKTGEYETRMEFVGPRSAGYGLLREVLPILEDELEGFMDEVEGEDEDDEE